MAAGHTLLASPGLQWLLARLFPRLREWPVSQWPGVLGRARQVEFDRLEQAVTLAGVILVAWQIKPVSSLETAALAAYLVQFIYMAPLVLLAVGPFFVRRIRRGLDGLARERDGTPAA